MLTIAAVTVTCLIARDVMAQTGSSDAATIPNVAPTAAPTGSAPVPLSYGVSQIIQLSKAKVSDDTIVSYVRNSGSSYGMDASQIIYLKQQSVSDTVINTMLNQPRPPRRQPRRNRRVHRRHQHGDRGRPAGGDLRPTRAGLCAFLDGVCHSQHAGISLLSRLVPSVLRRLLSVLRPVYYGGCSNFPLPGSVAAIMVVIIAAVGGGYHGGGGWHH